MYNISQKYFSRLVFFTKILIISGAYYIISGRLLDQEGLHGFLSDHSRTAFDFSDYAFIAMLLLFSLTNWILEILKWKTLVTFVAPVSFLSAAKQSLASLTASLITPNRIGEYGAKIIYFPKKERSKILLLNFLGNMNQMGITLAFGLMGIAFLWNVLPSTSLQTDSTTVFVLSLLLIALCAYIFKSKWVPVIHKIKNQYLKIPSIIHQKTLFYSFLRYLVFSHQFYLFLIFFGLDISYGMAMPLIPSMYLISSVIPGFVVFDWLVKGSVAVSLFGYFGMNDMIIVGVTSLMWILNFAVPSMIGTVFVLRFKGSTLIPHKNEVSK